MKRLLDPNHVGDIIPFSVATCDHLEKPGIGELKSTTFGRIFKNGQMAWLANGPSLEVVSTKTGERHSTWEFGVDLHETPVSVTCAVEVKGNNWNLIIGTDNGLAGGFVCIFDVKISRVVKTIAFPYKVTSLELISSVGGANPNNLLLCQELRYMYGIVAVGTQKGNLYLLDLMLDDLSYSDELEPSKISFITNKTRSIPNKREDASLHNRHLVLHINGEPKSKNDFKFYTSDFSCNIKKDDSYVSALLYVHQNANLIAGFSFGSFQIWNLDTLQLAHSSSVDDCVPAVVKFAFQEPDNDPRNFCYLWVIRGQSMVETKHDEVASAALYSLAFEQKKYINLFGYCHQDLNSCCLRFDFALNHDIMTDEHGATVGSRLISCRTVMEDAVSYGFSSQDHSNGTDQQAVRDESGNGLCVFVWESSFIDPSSRPRTVLAVFDINQWYQAQMPSKMRHWRNEMYPYFGFFSMTDITDKALPDFILDACILPNSVSYMKTNSTAEQFFQPSSLAFDTVTLIETGTIRSSFLGIHRQILHDIRKKGPSLLVSPQHIFDVCLFSNLLPLPGDANITNISLNVQREAILSLALEYNLIDFILKCASDWASGKSNSEGCNLRFLQEWAWKRVHYIKTSADRQFVPLFDCSGQTLDLVAVRHLHHQASVLKHLELIFRFLADHCQSIPTTDQGARELENRTSVISLLALYLEVTLWFLHYGILPERMEGSESPPGAISYPASLLTRIYSNRRLEIQRLSSTVNPSDVLLIDGILKNAGEAISSLWEKDGGNGLYPPPNLHALLSTYLISSVNVAVKHQIVQYIFLDLTELLGYTPESKVSENLMKFPAAFSLSSSVIKFTQGMWLLDHRDYEEAISVLLHPIINSTDILPWQHTQIMKAFLYQGEPQKALRYARVRHPTMLTAEDVRFHLTLLLANGLVAEAYQYQKASRDALNAEDLLQHFFLGCQQTKNFRDLLNLPLSPLEESHLIEFLHNCGDPHAREVLVIYYLQRARYVDAMCLNEQLHSRLTHEVDLATKERSSTRNAIVNGFSKLMPRCHNHLSQTMKNIFKPGRSIWHQVPKPQPLSTHVIASSKAPISQTSLIETIMGKIAEIWSKPPDDYSPIKMKPSSLVPDSLPLIGTPTLTKIDAEPLNKVVFPQLMNKDMDDSSLNYSSPTKRSRYFDVSPFHVLQSGKRHTSKIYSSESLTLLQTPPVRRKVPTAKLVSANSSLDTAPPSILKVRSLFRIQKTKEKVKQSTGLTPTPPATPEITSFIETPEFDSDKRDDRQLRFRFSPDYSEECSSVSSERSLGRFTQRDIHESTPIPDRSSPDVYVSPRLPLHSQGKSTRDVFALPEIDAESCGSSKSSEVEDMIIDSEKSSHTVDSHDEFKTDLPSETFGKDESHQFESFETADEDSTLQVGTERKTSTRESVETKIEVHPMPNVKDSVRDTNASRSALTPQGIQNVSQSTPPSLYEPLQVSLESKPTLKDKTPSPRPRTSFFSAEKSKERFMQMKTEVSLELAKAGVSSPIDFEHTEIEVVEAESQLATLVKQTLDSVLCRHSEELPQSSSSHLPSKSMKSPSPSKKLLGAQSLVTDKSVLQPLPLLSVSQHETVLPGADTSATAVLPAIESKSDSVSLPEQPHATPEESSSDDRAMKSRDQKSVSNLTPTTVASSVSSGSSGKRELIPVLKPLTVDVLGVFNVPSSPQKKSPAKLSLSPEKSRDRSEVSPKRHSSGESTPEPRYSLRKSLSPKSPSSTRVSPKSASSTNVDGGHNTNVIGSISCVENSSISFSKRSFNLLRVTSAAVDNRGVATGEPGATQPSPTPQNVCDNQTKSTTPDGDGDDVHDVRRTKGERKESDSSMMHTVRHYHLRSADDGNSPYKNPSAVSRSKSASGTPSPKKSSPGKKSGSIPSTPKSSPADRHKQNVNVEDAEVASKSVSRRSPKKSTNKVDLSSKGLSTALDDTLSTDTTCTSDTMTELKKGGAIDEEQTIAVKKRTTVVKRKTIATSMSDISKERRGKHLPGQYHFLFSDPTAVDTADTDPEMLKSPGNTTFIFSPPLTRSMSRKTRKTLDTPTLERTLRSEDGRVSTPTSSKLTKSTKKHVSPRALRLSGACETPINFVSPVLETSSGTGPKSKRATSKLSGKHGMTLRRQKGALLSRRSAKLK